MPAPRPNHIEEALVKLPTETEVNAKLAELQTAWDTANT